MQSTSILQYSQSVSGQHYNSISGSVNMGWHRGLNDVQRHLMVRFLDKNGRFITTQHIYTSDCFYRR
ncbi:hypothetical protein BDZ94DRAFT_1270640 [Collybia nuda]|uniref:Uncharacterized protein n=1 Tax=Collybia nuda TaxID=64659 RepID=A0A9P5XXL9_9AGAR|nr:hypothetical protein BDZ94DRAFT_1270640 [Collybia nuda]